MGETHSDLSHKHAHSCWTTALSGVPPTYPLFNGSICRHAHGFSTLFDATDGSQRERLKVPSCCCLIQTTLCSYARIGQGSMRSACDCDCWRFQASEILAVASRRSELALSSWSRNDGICLGTEAFYCPYKVSASWTTGPMREVNAAGCTSCDLASTYSKRTIQKGFWSCHLSELSGRNDCPEQSRRAGMAGKLHSACSAEYSRLCCLSIMRCLMLLKWNLIQGDVQTMSMCHKNHHMIQTMTILSLCSMLLALRGTATRELCTIMRLFQPFRLFLWDGEGFQMWSWLLEDMMAS